MAVFNSVSPPGYLLIEGRASRMAVSTFGDGGKGFSFEERIVHPSSKPYIMAFG
jgi:hypothetical protein